MLNRVMLIAILAMALVACAAQAPRIETDFSQEYNFSQIKSYAFVPGDGSNATSLYSQRIEQAITDEMALAGYRPAEAASADVLVNYLIVGREKQDIRTYHHGSAFHYYGRYRHYGCIGCGYTSVYVQNYTEGTLVIELVDRASEQVVWRSVTKERLKPEQTPDQRDAFIRQRVALMFQQYPPY